MTPLKAASLPDRRWYPKGDPAEWQRTTRQSMFVSVRTCVADAIRSPVPNDLCPHDLYGSDDIFRNLCACVRAYARALFDLGQNDDGAVKMIVAAAQEAARPEELHPAILGAIAQWCREARLADA
jgi:hypothetical protein